MSKKISPRVKKLLDQAKPDGVRYIKLGKETRGGRKPSRATRFA